MCVYVCVARVNVCVVHVCTKVYTQSVGYMCMWNVGLYIQNVYVCACGYTYGVGESVHTEYACVRRLCECVCSVCMQRCTYSVHVSARMCVVCIGSVEYVHILSACECAL